MSDTPVSAVDDRQFVTALARGLDVMRSFSAGRPELGSKEIARLTGLPQATVWRLCHTLSTLGYLVSGSVAGKFRVGAPALALGAASLHGLRYTEIIKPHLQAFVSRYPAAVVLAQQHELTLIYVLRCDGEANFLMKLPTGSSVSLVESSVGRACLAGMPAPMRAEWMAKAGERHGETRATREARLESACEQIGERGFVASYGEVQAAVSYVAVPLMSPDGAKAYALLCGGPAFALPAELMEGEIGPALVALAGQIQAALPGDV